MSNMMLIIEMFILAHEYGHVVLGHLNPNNATTFALNDNEHAETYNISQLQEFEADQFAFRQFVASLGMDPARFAYFPGLLFKFFELCEMIASRPEDTQPKATHPSASERWRRIKALGAVDESLHSNARVLDNAFNIIYEIAI